MFEKYELIDDAQNILVGKMLKLSDSQYERHKNQDYRDVMKLAIMTCHMNLNEKRGNMQESMGNPACDVMPFLMYACVDMVLNRVSGNQIG